MPVDGNFCHDCGVNAWRQWDEAQGCHVHEDFYVHNDLWDAVCPDDIVETVYGPQGVIGRNGTYVLCIGCFEKRLGRNLQRTDFKGTDPDGWYWTTLIGRTASRRFWERLNT